MAFHYSNTLTLHKHKYHGGSSVTDVPASDQLHQSEKMLTKPFALMCFIDMNIPNVQ